MNNRIINIMNGINIQSQNSFSFSFSFLFLGATPELGNDTSGQ